MPPPTNRPVAVDEACTGFGCRLVGARDQVWRQVSGLPRDNDDMADATSDPTADSTSKPTAGEGAQRSRFRALLRDGDVRTLVASRTATKLGMATLSYGGMV